MTGLALGRGKARMIGTYTTERDVTELPPMRLKLQAVTAEFAVALGTVFLVVTTGTGLRVIKRL
jgi:hypothetical protein